MRETIYQQAGAAVESRQTAIAEAVTSRHFALKPELEIKYGASGRAKCLQDNAYHLSYLAEALRAGQPALFSDYIAWASSMLAGRGVPETDLADNLSVLRESVIETLPADYGRAASQYIDAALAEISGKTPRPAERGGRDEPFADLAEGYLDALLRGRRDEASRLILAAIENRMAGVRDIYLHVFQKTQHEIGRLWQVNRISVAQEHYCTAATQMIMSQLYPYIFSPDRRDRTLVAASVSGDLHEIGVRIVADFFEMDGWDTFYLGANTPASSLLETVRERRADLLLLSATMTYHLRFVREIIEKMRADERTARVKVMVGGYPFNVAPDLWREFGVDGFATDADAAVGEANRLLDAG